MGISAGRQRSCWNWCGKSSRGFLFLHCDATAESDLDFLVDTTGTELTSLLRLGALYCELEALFEKKIDLVTVRAIMQESDMPSDLDFRNAILKERVRLDAVA